MGAVSRTARVLGNRSLGPGCVLLTFERPPGFEFRTGQYLSLGLADHREQREYSIYSGEADPHLQILVRVVPDGLVSRRLAALAVGDPVRLDGPFGYFTLEAARRAGSPLLFVATGTGISPFHSFVATHPDLDYRLYHGVRTQAETVLAGGFGPGRLVRCVSGEAGGDWSGRVTSALAANPPTADHHAFLCGNCDMIYEVFDALRAVGIPSDRISTEVYF